MSDIVISGVSHKYETTRLRHTQALLNLNLSITRGEFVAIVGPSGCGKSTLLRIIAGLLAPSQGTISIDGDDPIKARARHQIGFVFQDPALLPWRNARENIELPLELAGVSSRNRGSVDQIISVVRLRPFEDSYPKELSGGMRSRTAIARALTLAPSVLLMDEPFGSLDELTAYTLNLELLSLWQRLRPTVIVVTHSISQAVFLAGRVIVMSPRPGRVLQDLCIPLCRPRGEQTTRSSEFANFVADIRRALGGISVD